jgi:SNF family Na+-dependent transporter
MEKISFWLYGNLVLVNSKLPVVLAQSEFLGRVKGVWSTLVKPLLWLMVVILFVYWMVQIVQEMKEDARQGKKSIGTWLVAAIFAFGIMIFLEDIMALMGFNVTDTVPGE